MSRGRRSILNYLSSLAFTAITLLLSLVATPLLLRWLGQEKLGAFRASSDWGSYFTLLELGIGGALMPLIARQVVREQSESSLGAVMSSGFRAYRWIAIATVLVGLILIVVIPWLVPVTAASVGDLRGGVMLMVMAGLFLMLAPLRPLWEADQRSYVVTAFLSIQAVIVIGVSVLFARLGWGIRGQFAAILIGAIIYNVLLVWQSLRRHQDLAQWFGRSFKRPEAADPHHRELWRLNWPAFAINASGRVGLLTDSVVIAFFFGATTVVPFILTQRLAQLVQAQLQGIGNSTWAALTHVRATEGGEAFNHRVLQLTRVIMILGLAALLPVFCFNRIFVARWVGAGQFAGELLTLLACVNALMLGVYSFWGWLFVGVGRIAELARLSTVAGIVNVIVSISTTWWLGHRSPGLALLGPLIGTSVIFVLLYPWWMLMLLRRVFEIVPSQLSHAIAAPVAMALPYAALLFWLTRRLPILPWSQLILCMALAALAFLVLAWFVALGDADRKTWLARCRQALGREPAAALEVVSRTP